ncbi:MAG: hypothetical protein R3302_04795 [Sulfurimonadaceae bacterium]|nr:hypothetical protein [Sulfurimonadaceae bacterium]
MKYLIAVIFSLALFFSAAAADDYDDKRLERLFERLEHAPPGEQQNIRKQIRKHLKEQKRAKRQENLSRLRERQEMRFGEDREYRRDHYYRGRGHR